MPHEYLEELVAIFGRQPCLVIVIIPVGVLLEVRLDHIELAGRSFETQRICPARKVAIFSCAGHSHRPEQNQQAAMCCWCRTQQQGKFELREKRRTAEVCRVALRSRIVTGGVTAWPSARSTNIPAFEDSMSWTPSHT